MFYKLQFIDEDIRLTRVNSHVISTLNVSLFNY
jgi:hypothetical protein